MTNKFALRTFGCQMNKHDSERMAGLLTHAGYEETAVTAEASVIVFNTCCVRQHADDRLYGNVAALKQLKIDSPNLILAVGGCLAQKDGRQMMETLPHVNIVFGTGNQSRLPEMISRAVAGEKVCDTGDGDDFSMEGTPSRNHEYHAWMPITIGCDNFCTYCIVPYVRGRERSRPREDIITELQKAVGEGVIETTLLGQNVNSYGRDICGEPRFADLLRRVSNIDGLKRIRFTTSHPKDLSDDVIFAVAQAENIAPHFHLPVQAGSNRILKAMGRQYDRERYLMLAAKIREKIPGVAITTDIMVGFPGETETDFQETLELVKEVAFDQAFTFIYSARSGTKAAEMDGQISAPEKGSRFRRLVEAVNEAGLMRNKEFVGEEVNVYVEGPGRKGQDILAGRAFNNKLINFAGSDNLIGGFAAVKVTAAFSWFLTGELVR